MKPKSILLLAVALCCGLFAMLGVQQLLSGDKKPAEETAKVLVAIAEITPGTPLNEANVKFQDWPKDQVPEGAVTHPDEFQERGLKTFTVPGEIIMLAKLGEKGVFSASTSIPDGMRVITVPVDLTMSSSGLILPGDLVDVLVTFQYRDRRRGIATMKIKTALEAVKVFATDSVRDAVAADTRGEVKAKNISLLVTPDEANVLKLAEMKGKLHIALRPKTDVLVERKIVDPEELFGDIDDDMIVRNEEEAGPPDDRVSQFLDKQVAGQDEPEAEPVKNTWKIEIFSGGEKRIEEIELPDEPLAEEPEQLAVVGPATATPSVPSASFWINHLKTFFKPADENQPTPSVEATVTQ